MFYLNKVTILQQLLAKTYQKLMKNMFKVISRSIKSMFGSKLWVMI